MRKNEIKVNFVFNTNSKQPLGKNCSEKIKMTLIDYLGHCSVAFFGNLEQVVCVKRKMGRI